MIRVDTARILTNLTHCILKISTRCRWLPSTIPMTTSTSSPAHDFPIDGAALSFLCQFIDANGGEAAFQGLTTDNFKNRFIAPKTQAAKPVPERANVAGRRYAHSARDTVRELHVNITIYSRDVTRIFRIDVVALLLLLQLSCDICHNDSLSIARVPLHNARYLHTENHYRRANSCSGCIAVHKRAAL
jgi:hypothetical protein